MSSGGPKPMTPVFRAWYSYQLTYDNGCPIFHFQRYLFVWCMFPLEQRHLARQFSSFFFSGCTFSFYLHSFLLGTKKARNAPILIINNYGQKFLQPSVDVLWLTVTKWCHSVNMHLRDASAHQTKRVVWAVYSASNAVSDAYASLLCTPN